MQKYIFGHEKPGKHWIIQKLCISIILCVISFNVCAQNQDTVNVLRRSIDTTSANRTLDTTTQKDKKFLGNLFSKKDSTIRKRDTFFLKKKEFTPRGATLRSLILPGWGQAYNKEYWKIPIVAAGIGIPVGTYIFNRSWYNKSKAAVAAAFAIQKNIADTALIAGLDPEFIKAYNSRKNNPTGLEDFKMTAMRARNAYRKDMDYSILWTLALWGLNVADATVFAHLKNFDVSDDISMNIEPVYFQMNRAPGIKLVFTKKK